VNKNWSQPQGYLTYKTPTTVLTGPNNEYVAFGHNAISQYSEFVDEEKNDYNLFEHFKMILHKTSNWDKTVTVASKTGTELPALDVFVFMIKGLKYHCLEAIRVNCQQFRGRYNTVGVDSSSYLDRYW
jgi:hypothetical protein